MLTERQYTAAIDISSSGDNIIITAPTSTAGPSAYVAIDHINLIPTTAVSLIFKSGTNELSGTYPLDAKQTIVLDNSTASQYGVIKCNPNENFIINLGGAVQVSGFVNYRICNY